MTILEPNRAGKVRKLNAMLAFAVSSLIVVALLSLAAYNDTVDLSHGIKMAEREHKAALNLNAELKNELYKLTDIKLLRSAAQKGGLVSVTDPGYIEVSPVRGIASEGVSGTAPLAAAGE